MPGEDVILEMVLCIGHAFSIASQFIVSKLRKAENVDPT